MATAPDLEVIEALRDAISFIQRTALTFQNIGTPHAQSCAMVCDAEAARLYPTYERLTGCDTAAEPELAA